jgi:hypothetical protein
VLVLARLLSSWWLMMSNFKIRVLKILLNNFLSR